MSEYQLPLIRRADVAEGTMAFWFDTSGADFTFESGQNADFTLINPPHTDAEGNTRTFSIVSTPRHHDSIQIMTRMRPTAFKNSLREIPLGTKVTVKGPFGDMTLHEDSSKPAVLLAGGVGITPLLSIIQDATETNKPHRLILLYSNRTPAATASLTELEALAQANKKFTLVPTVTEPPTTPWAYEHGRIDADFIRRHVPEMQSSIFYLAGPDAFTAAMRTLLLGLGISKDSIRTESFSGY